MVSIVVDRKEIEVVEGTSLLAACLDNGIAVPHLCYLEGCDRQPASCRLCWVEIEGVRNPVAACTVPVRAAMVVRTDAPAVRRLQKTALRLLLSVHAVDCKNCPANRRCALQDLARLLGIGLRPGAWPRRLKEPPVDTRHPCLDYYPNRCVLCGRCVAVCRQAHDRPELTFVKRGIGTVVGFFDRNDVSRRDCAACRRCIDACPVAALIFKEGADELAGVIIGD
ncbi:MAG: 2Fe-2S iron-sulfur cluster-binding protein [Desulfobacterales bacterium]